MRSRSLLSMREYEREKLRKRGKREGEEREHATHMRDGRENIGGSMAEGEEEKEGRRW